MNHPRKEFKATLPQRVLFFLLAYFWILFAIYMVLYRNPTLLHMPGQIIGFLLMECMTWGIAGSMSNYCIVERQSITIKNYIIFWKNKKYELEKISSIEYLKLPRVGYAFKIKRRNGSSSSHVINGLSDEELIELYHIFNTYKIKLKGFPEGKTESNPSNLNKTWNGFYQYGPEYTGKFPKVNFATQLTYYKDGFEGFCKESGGGAHREAAAIKGFMDDKNNTINFILKYPYSYWEEEDGTMLFDTSMPHPDINYLGNFNSETNSYEGVWDMTTVYYDENDEPFEITTHGTWEMAS